MAKMLCRCETVLRDDDPDGSSFLILRREFDVDPIVSTSSGWRNWCCTARRVDASGSFGRMERWQRSICRPRRCRTARPEFSVSSNRPATVSGAETSDWAKAFPGFDVWQKLCLLRRVGPTLQGICLERTTSGDEYFATAHVHALTTDFPVFRSCSTSACSPRQGSQNTFGSLVTRLNSGRRQTG